MVYLANIRSSDARGAPVKIDQVSADRLMSSLRQILESTMLCALATMSAGNQAHINIAYFAYSDELEIYFLSHPNSTHCRNLSVNPSMALAAFSPSQNWGGPDRGAQLFGICARAEGSDLNKAEIVYGRRFPAYADWKQHLPVGDPALEYGLYRFATNRVKVLDEKEFGGAIFVEAGIERK